jgi:integrase
VLVLTAAKTKTRRTREIPISTPLKAVLEMRRDDASGKRHVSTAYVFGDTTGARVGFPKRSWEIAKLVAHGHTVEYQADGQLTVECRTHLETIDLHFHDLRREAGSRWLDARVPLHTIQHWLGHTNIAQTSTYLNVTDTGSHEAMERFDAARVQRGATDAPSTGNEPPQPTETAEDRPNETADRIH